MTTTSGALRIDAVVTTDDEDDDDDVVDSIAVKTTRKLNVLYLTMKETNHFVAYNLG